MQFALHSTIIVPILLQKPFKNEFLFKEPIKVLNFSTKSLKMLYTIDFYRLNLNNFK